MVFVLGRGDGGGGEKGEQDREACGAREAALAAARDGVRKVQHELVDGTPECRRWSAHTSFDINEASLRARGAVSLE